MPLTQANERIEELEKKNFLWKKKLKIIIIINKKKNDYIYKVERVYNEKKKENFILKKKM